MLKPPIVIPTVIAKDVQVFRAEDMPDEYLAAIEAELADIEARMCQPLSREQQVATEVQLWPDLAREKDLSLWSDEDWLQFARHMIQVVEHARDISAEDARAAMTAPWQGPPLPKFEDL